MFVYIVKNNTCNMTLIVSNVLFWKLLGHLEHYFGAFVWLPVHICTDCVDHASLETCYFGLNY